MFSKGLTISTSIFTYLKLAYNVKLRVLVGCFICSTSKKKTKRGWAFFFNRMSKCLKTVFGLM